MWREIQINLVWCVLRTSTAQYKSKPPKQAPTFDVFVRDEIVLLNILAPLGFEICHRKIINDGREC